MSVQAINKSQAKNKVQAKSKVQAVPAANLITKAPAASITTPMQIPGVQAWFRGDIGFTAATGVWIDASGNGKDTTPQSATRPTAGTAINSKKTVTFPGSASQALITGSVTLGTFTIAAVVSFTGANGYIVVHNTAASTNGGYLYADLGSSFLVARSTVLSSKNIAANWGRNAVKNILWTYGGSHNTNLVQVGGVQQATTDVSANDVGAAGVAGSIYIGADQGGTTPSTGDVGELIVWNRVLTQTETSMLNVYLHNYWNV